MYSCLQCVDVILMCRAIESTVVLAYFANLIWQNSTLISSCSPNSVRREAVVMEFSQLE